MDFFQKKNIEFYDFLNENFGIRKAKKWDDIAKNITKAKISATYKFFSKLYPLNIDYSLELQTDSKKFISLHYNDLKAKSIIDEVARFSLYSDSIVVFHPIQNPSITNQKLNPIKNPKYWLQNFIDSLHFYVVLQNWVRAGIVRLIVNPYEFDLKLREEFDKKAFERVSALLSMPEIKERGMDDASESVAEMFAPSFVGKNESQIKIGLLNISNPKFEEEEAEMFAKIILSKQPFVNPLLNKLNIPFGQDSIMMQKGGGNVESISYVAKLINGNIYTSNNSNWDQLSSLGDISKWTKIAHLYSKIELPFLNNIDTSFALNLRKEDRLAGVRKSLRNIYSSVNTIEPDKINEDFLIELNEEFIEEVKKADAEWDFIKKDAQSKRAYWAGSSVIGSPIILNETTLLPLILGSAFWLGNNLRNEKLNIKKFKKSNPLSVYVDLKHQQPSFFSELKNCIF